MGSELFAHAGLRWHEEWPGRAEPLEQEPHWEADEAVWVYQAVG